MSRTNKRARPGVTLAALAFLWASPAPGQEPGPAGKIGERIDEAASGVRRAVGRAGETLRDQFERAKATINAMGIESRVYGRLHWDKALDRLTIDISATKDGTVTLTGTVPDTAARARAVGLAGDTTGVTRVVDQLTIATPPTSP